jgi:DNA-binding transcriptional LysR family regulator
LTELGQLMLFPLSRALASASDAKRQADAFRRRESSPLRIGLEFSIPAAVLTPALTALRRENTDIELTLHQDSKDGLSERMLDGEIDLALMVEDADLHERMNRWMLFEERYVLIFPPEHRFHDKASVSAADLAEQSLLLHENAACPVRRFVAELYSRSDLRPHRQHFANSQEQILEMVNASLGVSVVGERLPATLQLGRRPISSEPDGRKIVLTAMAGRPLGPTPALFMKMLRARAWSRDAALPDAA